MVDKILPFSGNLFVYFFRDRDCRFLAAAYQETSIVIWDTMTDKPERILSGHEKPVTCLRWGGTDLIYSSSQDRTIRVWRSTDGVLCRRLDMHGHWINSLALSVDYVLRTGPFDPADAVFVKPVIPSTAQGEEKSESSGIIMFIKNIYPQFILLIINYLITDMN